MAIAWLQRGNLVIDISADQFEDQNSPVVVMRNSIWHEGFEGTSEGRADFLNYDMRTVSCLGDAYQKIKDIAVNIFS